MKRLAIIALAALAPLAAPAQTASQAETEVVSRIAGCLVQGLPEDWQRIHMIVELAEPGAGTGDVRYLVARAGSADFVEPYLPCDTRTPALILLEAREQQTPERRGWTGARIVLYRNGKFQLNYDYPDK